MKINQINVRMYRQGFGDCFLLTFSGEPAGTPFHMLIDCGVISGKQMMREIAQDISAKTGNQLDLLVITHEHSDHLSGFRAARDVFDQINVKELWMAWTEKPGYALADDIRAGKKQLINALFQSLDRHKAAMAGLKGAERTQKEGVVKKVASLLSFEGVTFADDNLLGAANFSETTAEAFDYVKKKTTNHHYLSPKSSPNPIPLPGCEGVRVYVLGPPEDEKKLRRMESKTAGDLYMSSAGQAFSFASAFSDENAQTDAATPFDGLALQAAEAEKQAKTKQKPGKENREADLHPFGAYYDPGQSWRRIDSDWLDASESLAVQTNGFTNNTSLVLAIELVESGKVLLFPGDAQLGNWESWHSQDWTIRENGSNRQVSTDALLARTVFYKVGHHGSHNATAQKEGLEKMTSPDLVAVVPVSKSMALGRGWDKIPYQNILDALRIKTQGRFLQADDATYPDWLPQPQPATPQVNGKDLYVDVVIA